MAEAGRVNTDGLVGASAAVAKADDPVVRNLRAAGAISIGRSNVPAFSSRWFTDNDLYGRTLNPWHRAKTPGGSSGGAAAAVAAGLVPLAHGNDIGGSVRYPAHVCGVMGLRPTVGRIPYWVPSERVPTLSLGVAMMCVEGVLARSAADLDLGLRAMAQPDLQDPSCVPVSFHREPALTPGATRIGVVRSVDGRELHASQHAAVDQAASWLRDAGFGVDEIELPQLAEAARLWLLFMHTLGVAPPPGQLREIAGEAAARNIELGRAMAEQVWGDPTLEMYLDALARRNTLVAEVQEVLIGHRVILLPGSGAGTPDHDADQHPDSARALLAAQWPNTAIPTLGLPAIAAPTGLHDGLPAGVQLLGRRFDESALLDVAEQIEAQAPRLTPVEPAW